MAATLQAKWTASHGLNPIDPWRYVNDQGNSSLFQQRVSIAMTAAAISISNEAAGTTNHANRVVLAKGVLQRPGDFTVAFTQALASQGLDFNSDDAAISAEMGVVWDAIAGVA
ncbi:MAG: hypothetical protein M3Z98_07030 [Candidatus Dormibacteraeota bacterium]|nr:hypothetical protein [Candidatus Dormibacteraeota bacterium]